MPLPRSVTSDFSLRATRALRDFRVKHGFELVPWSEGYFGDVCGIKALLESEKGTVSTCK